MDLFAVITAAVAGLLYPGTDCPIEVRYSSEPPKVSVDLANSCLEYGFDRFFDALEDPKVKNAVRFHTLRELLTKHLSDVKVYRVGHGPLHDVFIYGQTVDKKFIILHTFLFEEQ